jgi:tocopherol O-methyltransferase
VSDYRSLGKAAGFQLLDYGDLTKNVSRTWPLIFARILLKLLTNTRYIRFLFERRARNRIFALTILRIWLAYRTGAMRYGIFTFVKPSATR